MDEKESKYIIDFDYERSEFTIGNTVEIEVGKHDGEIRADIEARKKQSLHIFGQVKSLEGMPLPGALVRLQRIDCIDHTELVTLADTLTDRRGYYQFDTLGGDERLSYLIIVERPVMDGVKIKYCMVGCAAFNC